MGELERLDELTIPAPETRQPLQRLGVMAQFLVPDGHLAQTRRAARTVILDADRRAAGAFELWMTTQDTRPRALRGPLSVDADPSLTDEVDQPDGWMSLALLQRDNPPRWLAEMMMQPDNPRKSWLSRIAVAAPPSIALADPDVYVETVRAWAALLRPQYGSAGFALVDEIGMAHMRSGAAWPWLQRYPGLDCATFNVQPKPDGFQSVGWVTILGDGIVTRLGGLEAIERSLAVAAADRDAPAGTVIPYIGGALIRAGRVPQLGDRTRGEVPAAYRAVNAALRPARFEDYPVGPNIHLIDAPRGLDRREATLHWVRRFDD